MPVPVTQGLIAFMKDQLKANVWELEVPRFDQFQNPINPQATTSPTNWPVITCHMQKPGFRRDWNCGTDPYNDKGSILVEVHGITKDSVQALYDSIDALWAKTSNWRDIAFSPAGDAGNPFYVSQMMLGSYWIGQEADMRLAGSLLYFRGELIYDPCSVHGAISTQ